MITIEIGSYFWTLVVYTSSLLISLIFIIICCVCNPKSKRFNKHKSFILSHEFLAENDDQIVDQNGRNNQDLTSTTRVITNQDDMISIVKHISLNRALPDIPQTTKSDNDHIQPSVLSANSSVIEINADADPVYTSADNNNITIDNKNEDNIQNHAYARIRNLITDSSTENDTDDYSDPSVIVQNANPYPSPNHSHQHHHQLVDPDNDSYEHPISPSERMIRSENVVVESVVEMLNNQIEPKREISYNTISVREPLAKVLAERENNNNVEHHYNEVEDDSERLSSFYEEINGGGSATYSKISEPPLISASSIAQNNCQPSTSSSYHQQQTQQKPNEISMMINDSANNLPLYAFVDKKSKKLGNNDLNPVSTSITGADVFDNLYTKVMKPKKETSSANKSLQRYSPPPPLPPPLNKDQTKVQQRNTIIFIGATSTTTMSTPSAQITISDERDPGYETVYKEINQNIISDDHQDQIDYGYEAIANDPAYEIVSTAMENGYETIQNNYHNDELIDQGDDQSDPNYEIISNIKSTTTTSTTATMTNNTTTIIINTGSSSVPSSSSTSITNIFMSNNNNNENNNTNNTRSTYSSSDDNFVIIEHL